VLAPVRSRGAWPSHRAAIRRHVAPGLLDEVRALRARGRLASPGCRRCA
jgi:hypothetical protein